MSLPSTRRRLLVSVLATIPWIVLLLQLVIMVPRYSVLFAKFGLALPWYSQAVLKISLWCDAQLPIAFVLTCLAMALSGASAYAVQKYVVSWSKRVYLLLLIFGVPCLAFLVVWLGVALPHRTLLEGLSR